MPRKFITFVLLLGFARSAFAPLCPILLKKLGESDVFASQPALHAAAEAVIRERLKKKIPVPSLSKPPELEDDTLKRRARKLSVMQAFGSESSPIKLTPLGVEGDLLTLTLRDGSEVVVDRNDHYRTEYGADIVSIREGGEEDAASVFSLQTPDGVKFFRPMDHEYGAQKAARTLAASELAQAMKMPTVPRAVWGQVNGRLGAISDEAPGAPPRKSLTELVAEGKCDRRSALNAAAMEFLLGNLDGVKRNVHVASDGTVRVFDHDAAFVHGIPPIRGDRAPLDTREVILGVELPENYTPEFAANLKALSPANIRKLLAPFISPEEVEGVIFRREILLKDLKLRPSSVL